MKLFSLFVFSAVSGLTVDFGFDQRNSESFRIRRDDQDATCPDGTPESSQECADNRALWKACGQKEPKEYKALCKGFKKAEKKAEKDAKKALKEKKKKEKRVKTNTVPLSMIIIFNFKRRKRKNKTNAKVNAKISSEKIVQTKKNAKKSAKKAMRYNNSTVSL